MNKKIIGPILLSALVLASCNLTNTKKRKPHSSSTGETSLTTEDSTSSGTSSGSSSSGGTTSSGSSSTSGSSSSSGTSSTSTDPVTPVVTSVTLSSHAESVKQGASVTLTVTVTGKNNPTKTGTWSTSNSSIATVSNGVVSVKSGATVGATCTITARSTVTTSVYDTCTITVLSSGSTSESYTILIYMCGSNLESDYADDSRVYGLASSDLREMASVSGMPSNVNIVVETGGAKKWASNPGIDKNYLQRRRLNNGTWELVSNETKANMGLQTTLQNFLSWGLKTYPADHTGVIMWNHGGAVSGCCFDENYSNDGILPSEMGDAVKNALSAAGQSGQKLDWVGYDCCIMSYAELASINAQYFNYQVSSQELETGTGWDYDAWLPALYQNTSISTETLLAGICDSFVDENGGTDDTSNDQCLSVLNLQNFSAFQTAFESFASGLTSTSWSKIKSSYTSALRFADLSDYGSGEYGYGVADMKDFLTKAGNNGFNTTAASNALANVTVHSSYGGFYNSKSKPCGLDVFVPGDSAYNCQISEDEYGESDTKLTNWRSFCVANGTFYGSGGSWGY